MKIRRHTYGLIIVVALLAFSVVPNPGVTIGKEVADVVGTELVVSDSADVSPIRDGFLVMSDVLHTTNVAITMNTSAEISSTTPLAIGADLMARTTYVTDQLAFKTAADPMLRTIIV